MEAGAKTQRRTSSRTRSERKLGWLLCAPAVIAMLAVTAYPIGYAFVLSLQKLDLRFPEQTEFVGLANYGTVLSSELWWTDVFNTVFIMVISVTIELVLGMAIALVMHRAIFGRGVDPHLGPDPLRDHHRRRRLRLAVRLRLRLGLRQQPAVHRRRNGLVRRPLQLASR